MNQFLSNKIIASIVAVALLVGVGVLISSGDTSSTTRNAALVVATPCTKPGQVTKVSKQSVVCAKTNTGSLWYATMKAKGKVQACTKPGAIRKKSKIVWVCGVVKKKKLWQATRPLPPAVIASTTVIEPGATQPTPALDSTQVATPEAPVVADNTVLADPQIPEDKIVTQVIDDATTPPVITPPVITPPVITPPVITPPVITPQVITPQVITPQVITPQVITPQVISLACAAGGTCAVGDAGPGGGEVFYVAPTEQSWGRYLEAAPTDYQVNGVRAKVEWGCSGTSTEATGTAIGAGKANTAMILTKCKTADIAAGVANKYSTVTAAAGQWFLPSKDELNQMYINRVAIGGFLNAANYWSSSERPLNAAWFQVFGFGSQYHNGKNYTSFVRPVRAFSANCAAGGPCVVGETGPGGGKVFYVAPTQQSWGRYLEVAPTDYQVNYVRTKVAWGCNSTSTEATATAIGTGKANTDKILNVCTTADIAAGVANKYSTSTAGAGQWFLPSRDELNELCKIYSNGRTDTIAYSANQSGCTGKLVPTGGFAADNYWSSSEDSAYVAWGQYFGGGSQNGSSKYYAFYVRPVRAF